MNHQDDIKVFREVVSKVSNDTHVYTPCIVCGKQFAEGDTAYIRENDSACKPMHKECMQSQKSPHRKTKEEKEWRRRGYRIIPQRPEDLYMDCEESNRMIGAGVPTITVRTDEINMLFDTASDRIRDAVLEEVKDKIKNEKRIREFLETTPLWVKIMNFREKFGGENPCVYCGIDRDKINGLYEALSNSLKDTP